MGKSKTIQNASGTEKDMAYQAAEGKCCHEPGWNSDATGPGGGRKAMKMCSYVKQLVRFATKSVTALCGSIAGWRGQAAVRTHLSR